MTETKSSSSSSVMAQQNVLELLKSLEVAQPQDEVFLWLETISSQEFGLVKTIAKQFVSLDNKSALASPLLRILQYLSEYETTTVTDQLKDMSELSSALIDIITADSKADVDGLGESAVILLQAMEPSSLPIAKLSELFVAKLFDMLDVQKDEIYVAAVQCLVAVNFRLDRLTANPVLDLCCAHPNARYFGEALLSLVNRGEGDKLYHSVKCICDILEHRATRDFFYTNDLKVFIDIAVRCLIGASDVKLRVQYVKALGHVIADAEYKTHKHRAQDMLDALELQLDDSNIEQADQQVIEKILVDCLSTLEGKE
eukprot:GILK01008990.1.p1 GENE.GILK01008990.1~~GILK01008990.1.p1  ORF type:complete len:320 (+),score=81.73 GILK01008990.1:23-961(+)